MGINHPYIAGITRFPDRSVKTIVFSKKKEFVAQGKKEEYGAWKEAHVQTCAHDIRFVITRLHELAATKSEFLSSHADTARIGVMGHSFGGLVSVRAARLDSRIACGVDMDGGLRGDDVNASFATPFVIMLGEKSNQWQGDDVKDLQAINALCTREGTNIYKVMVPGAGHALFSDIPLQLQTTVFMRLLSRYRNFGIGLSLPYACTVLTEKIGPCLLAFFDKQLKNIPSPLFPENRGELTIKT